MRFISAALPVRLGVQQGKSQTNVNVADLIKHTLLTNKSSHLITFSWILFQIDQYGADNIKPKQVNTGE